ncbi:DUF4785 domain-containing protein [Shewanella sp.]|uniref:DUF4785 domain-containing protein n=1 Tax=Shewanella sp. TaxID=50422 RepID=UPI0035666683
MNKHNKLAAAVLMALLLGACQNDDASVAETFSIQTTSLSAPISSDFAPMQVQAPTSAGINTSRDAIGFVAPLSGEYQSKLPQTSQSLASNEYWFSVSGEELNRGVNLNVTQGGAVIRIAPRADMSSGALYHANPISPEQLELQAPKGAKVPNLVRSMASSEALATAGMTDNSSALLLSAAAPAGNYRLSTRQPLDSRARYLVNVKEKGSPYNLTLSSPMLVSTNSGSVELALGLDGMSGNINTNVRLKQGDTELQLAQEQQGDKLMLRLPDNLSADAPMGLSELVIDVTASDGDRTVRRTIKSAFKLYAPSARISPEVETQWHDGIPVGLNLSLELADAGRFAASAVLTGTDANGNEVAILRTEAAAWLEGNGSLTLPLSKEIIATSGVSAPFHVRELELKDQGQMARLSFQDRALSL